VANLNEGARTSLRTIKELDGASITNSPRRLAANPNSYAIARIVRDRTRHLITTEQRYNGPPLRRIPQRASRSIASLGLVDPLRKSYPNEIGLDGQDLARCEVRLNSDARIQEDLQPGDE
jgi:hypothetical protein